jgi:hypothetical protein
MLSKELADLWSEIVARRKTCSEIGQMKSERWIEHRPTTEKQSFTPRQEDNTSNSRNFTPCGKDNAANSRNNEAAEELRKALEKGANRL